MGACPDPVGERGECLLAGDDPLALPGRVAPADVDFDKPGAYADAQLDKPVRRWRPPLLTLLPLSPLLGRREWLEY